MWRLTAFVPIFSSLVWLAMLITMISVWAAEGHPIYPWMNQTRKIPYISDIGSSGLKPLFIAMSTVTVVSFDLAFILERYLRHTGRLTPNTSIWQKLYSIFSIIAAIVGAAGLILLTNFDNAHHSRLHNIFLALFIGGYIISAVFICWEYQRLGIHFREHSVLRYSFWVKLAFILVEVALAVAFGVTQRKKLRDTSAVIEWVIAFIFFFYVLSFFMDFMPAAKNKNHYPRESVMNMVTTEEAGALGDAPHDDTRYFRGAPMAENGGAAKYTNGDATANANTNGYANGGGMMNGYANGHTNINGNGNGHVPLANGNGNANANAGGFMSPPKPVASQPASRNF